MKKNSAMLIAFVSPAAIFFILIFLYPILRTLLMSFFRIEGVTDGLAKWHFVGLKNYGKLLGTTLFRISMWNLFRIWLFGGLIVLSLALLYYLRNPRSEFLPRHDLSSEYRFRRSPCNYVATICLQPEIRFIEELFHTSPSAETRLYPVAQ